MPVFDDLEKAGYVWNFERLTACFFSFSGENVRKKLADQNLVTQILRALEVSQGVYEEVLLERTRFASLSTRAAFFSPRSNRTGAATPSSARFTGAATPGDEVSSPPTKQPKERIFFPQRD